MENASTKAYENGFAAGVYYAGRNTECYTEYIGSFNDPIKGGEVAEDMMQDGVDIIYHAAGTSGLGIVDAVKEKDKYVIGSGMDQSYLAKENVIASTVKDTSSLLKDIIIEAKEETHSTLSGMRYYGISEGVLHMEYNGDVVSQSLKTRVEMISNKIISEEIEIPATDVQLEIFKDNF